MTTEELDRERLEMDIVLLECAQLSPGLSDACFKAIDRAIGRLRADLAKKLDGPAPGFVRVRIDVWRNHRGLLHADIIRDGHEIDNSSVAIVVADVPIPCVVKIEGKVEK